MESEVIAVNKLTPLAEIKYHRVHYVSFKFISLNTSSVKCRNTNNWFFHKTYGIKMSLLEIHSIKDKMPDIIMNVIEKKSLVFLSLWWKQCSNRLETCDM